MTFSDLLCSSSTEDSFVKTTEPKDKGVSKYGCGVVRECVCMLALRHHVIIVSVFLADTYFQMCEFNSSGVVDPTL